MTDNEGPAAKRQKTEMEPPCSSCTSEWGAAHALHEDCLKKHLSSITDAVKLGSLLRRLCHYPFVAFSERKACVQAVLKACQDANCTLKDWESFVTETARCRAVLLQPLLQSLISSYHSALLWPSLTKSLTVRSAKL
jgi:hypothetical protein